MKSRAFLFSTLLLFFLQGNFAQQAVLPAGAEATGSGGTACWSLGQLACITISAAKGTVMEGIQLPYEIIFDGIYEDPGIGMVCTAFPNPASDFVTLKIENHDLKDLAYTLCTMNGMVLRTSVIWDKETLIPMHKMASGTYLLTVSENGSALECYKIIKK